MNSLWPPESACRTKRSSCAMRIRPAIVPVRGVAIHILSSRYFVGTRVETGMFRKLADERGLRLAAERKDRALPAAVHDHRHAGVVGEEGGCDQHPAADIADGAI